MLLGTERPGPDSERPPARTDSTMPPEGFNPDTAPRFGLNAQYTKDLSFEHPMAPRSFSMPGAPQISVNVGTQAERVSDDLYEVTLRIMCEAKHRSEEHTSELQSLMRISYAVFCLKKKKHRTTKTNNI